MKIEEIAKDILVALIDKNLAYSKYSENDENAPAEKVGEAYRIIIRAVKQGMDEVNK